VKSFDDIMAEVQATFTTKWNVRDGQVVPEPKDVGLANDGVHLDATILYADMHDSTGLVDGYKDWFAAEVYKSYLLAACHVLRNNGGEITSFDGDRVMAVFIGKSKNSDAAKAALQINSVVIKINEALKANYKSSSFTLRQAVGVDTSKILVARTGIRANNDLVWVGPAANHAAKLCDLTTDSMPSVISANVFKTLNDASKFGGNPKINMWHQGYDSNMREIYRSSWRWDF
jgi:class 3 adenylate cyclase